MDTAHDTDPWLLLPDGSTRRRTEAERRGGGPYPTGAILSTPNRGGTTMHLKEIEIGLKVMEAAEAVLPDVEKVVETVEAADGGRPALKEVWPAIKAALDTAIDHTPVGEIRV